MIEPGSETTMLADRPFRRRSAWLAALLCGAVVLGTLMRQLGRWHWMLELTTHFVVQATVLAGLATLMLLVIRHWRVAGLAGVLTLLNAVEWVSYYSLTSRGSKVHTREESLVVVSANVYSRNRNADAVYQWLQQSDADVVFLSEVDAWWAHRIASWTADWPHQLIRPRDDNFGLALISRHPISDSEMFDLDGFDPAVQCRVQAPSGEWTIVGLHPFPPAGGAYSTLRNQQLASASQRIRSLPRPRVVLGDLNSTSSSPFFRDFMEVTGLEDSRVGFGWQPTWPAGNPVLRVPIDHCLVEPAIQVLDRHVGPDVGSDHLPVCVKLILRH